MSLLHAGVKSHTSLLHRRMAVGTLPDSMDRHDVTISCPAPTLQPPPAAPTPSFTGCFGLPYHDHNYGMPPPATPPTSPNVPETVPQSVPQPLPPTPLPPTRINGHIDIEDISVTTEVTTTPEVSEDAVAVTTDDSVTRCICDFQHDDGYMICCDRCSVWQHVDCMGVDRDNIPENYLCELCEPRKCDKQHAIQIQTRKRQELAALGILPIVDSSATETEDETVRLGINPPTPKRTQKRKKKKDRDKATKVVRKVKVKKDRDGKLKLKKEKVNGGKVVNSVLTQSPPKRKVLNVKKKAANRKANKASAMGFTISNEDARDGWDSPDSDGYEDAKTNQYSVDIQNMLATHKFNGVRTTAASRPCEQLLAQLWKVINIDGVQKGLEAAEDVACDMPVIEYKGKVLLRDQYDRETLFFNKPQPFTLFYSKFENMELCIDASSFGNEARFVRRSCTPNAEVRHLADSTSMRFYIYAQQDIVKGDEVTIPFDSNYKDSSREVECACGKPTCLVAKIHPKEEAHPARRKKKRLSSRSISGSEHEPGEVVPLPQLQLQPQPHPQPLSPVAAPVSPRKVSPPVAAPATKRRKTSGHRASFSEDTPPVVLEPLILASPPPPALPNSPPPPPPPASRTTRSAYQQQLQKEQKAHDKEIKVEVGASPPAKHHRKERIASPRRLSTSSLSPKSHPTPKLDVVKVEDIKTEPTHFDDGATDEGVSQHCNTGTEHDSSEDTEKHKKMTREERKMEAIMKAFEKLEKREERRKEALARLQEHGKKPPSTPTTPAAGVKDDVTSPIKEEIKEEPKPEIKPADIRPKVNKTKKKKTGTPLRRRSRMNSSASGTSSAADVHSSADESSNLSAPAASTPTTADSSAPNSTATTPLTAGPQARAFRFPKTKKHLMNEWFSEKGLAEVAKPLSIKTESLDEPATPKDSVEFMQCVPSPHTNSMSHLRRSSISGCSQVKVAATSAACTASSQRTSGDCSMGSAKKRWLRQAMFESTGQPSNGQSPGGSMSPVHSGAMSPNPNFSSTFSMNSPGQSSSSVDFVTPLKKRRMARESICLDIPPAPSTSTNAQDGGTASEGTASEGEKSDTESAPNTSGPSADDIINYVPPNGIKAHLPIPPLGTSNNLFERLGFKSAKSPGDSGPMKQEGNEGCVSESLLSPTRGWARDEPDGTMMVTSSPDAVSLAVMNRSSQALLVNASSASVHAAVCSLSAMSSPRASATISSTLLGGSPHSSPSRSAGSIPYVSPLLDPTLHSSPRRLSDSSRQWLYNSSDTNILDLTRTLDAKTAIVCDSNVDTESDSVRRSTSSTLPGRQAMDTSSLCASDAKISNALDIVGHPESTSDHNHRTLQPPVSSSGSNCSRISETSQLSSPRSCTSSNSRTLTAISGDNSHYTSTCADSHITNHNSNNNAAVAGTSAMSQEVCSSVKQSCSDSEDSGVRLEADASVMDGVGSTLRVDSDDSFHEDVGSWCSPANSNQPLGKSSREHSTGKRSHSPSSENSDHDSGVQGVSASTLSGDPDARTTTPDSRSSSSHSNENNTLICIDDNEVHTTQSLPKQSTSAEAASHSIDRVECSNADNSCPESAEHVRTSQVYSVQENSEGVLRVRHASNTLKQEVSVEELEAPSGSVEVDRSEDDESSKPVSLTQGEERESEVAKQGSDCEQSIAPSGSKSPAVNVADEPRPSGSSDCSAVSKEAIMSAAVSSEMVSNSDNIETSQASSAAMGGSEAGPVSGSESADGENEAGGRRCRTESVSDTQIDSNHDSSAMDISMGEEGPVCSNSMERQESAAVAEDVGRSLEEGEIGESDESMEVEPSVSSSNTTAVIGAKTQHSSPGLANSATSTSSPTTLQRRADSLSPGSSVARTPSLTPPHCSGLSSSDNAVSCSSEIIDAPQQPSLGEDGEVHSSDLRSGLDHVSAANDMESNREEEMEEGEISDSEPEEPLAGAEAEAEASRPSLDFGPGPSVSQSQPSDALVTSQEHVSFSNSTAVNNSQANVEVTSHSDGVSSPEVVAESSETVNAIAPEVDPISSSSNDARTRTGVENDCVSASSSSVAVSLHSLQLTGSSHESGISSSSSNGRQAFSDTNSRPSADSSTTETHITSSSQIACSETNASLHPQPSEDSEPSGSVSSDSEVGQGRGCADSELRMVESSTWGLSSSCSGTDAVTASSAQGNFQNCSSSSSSISSNSSLLGDSNIVPISSSSSSSSPNKSSLFSHCTNSSSHLPTTSTPATPPAKKKVSLLEYRQRMRKRTVGPSSSSRGDATTPPVSSSEAAHSLTPRSTPSPRSTTPTLATLPLFESISSSSSDHRHRGSVSPLPSRRDRKDDSDVRWGSPGSSSDWNREPTTPQPTLSLTERLRREFGVDASESEEEDVKERHWSGGSPPPPPPPPPPPSHSSDISAVHSSGFLPSSSMGSLPVPMLNSRPKPGPSVHMPSGSYGHVGSHHSAHHPSSSHMANPSHPHSLTAPVSNVPSRVPHSASQPPLPIGTDPRQSRERPLPPPPAGANSTMMGPSSSGQQPLLRGGAQRGGIPSLMSLPSFPAKPYGNNSMVGNSHPVSGVSGTASSTSSSYIQLAQASSSSGYNSQVSHPPTGSNQPSPVAYNQPMPSHPNYNQPGVFNQAKASSTSGYNQLPSSSFNSPTPGAGFNQTGLPGAMNRVGFSAGGPPQPPVNTNFPVQHNSMPSSHMPQPMPPSLPPPPPPPPPPHNQSHGMAAPSSSTLPSSSSHLSHHGAAPTPHHSQQWPAPSSHMNAPHSSHPAPSSSSSQQQSPSVNNFIYDYNHKPYTQSQSNYRSKRS